MAPKKSASRTVVYAALAGNLLVATTKFIASALTGGSAMLAEAVHSLVDTGNQILLLYGLRRAEQLPTPERPLGYGRELYFWSFIVALLIFSLGAGVAILEGILHILDPHPIESAYINYIVLALAFLFEGASWLVALRKVGTVKGREGYLTAFRRSKDPPSFMVLFEDTAALIGIALAALGTWASVAFAMPMLDGVASILIGLVLAGTAAILATETKSLLIGEPASPEIVKAITELALADPSVLKVNGIISAHLAPDQILATLSLEFDDNLTTSAIESKIVEMEERIRAAHPEIILLFIKPQTPGRYQQARQRRFAPEGQT
ncbi:MULTISPECIES: cation diffusion facilitator family transporter [Rhodomicrobium]|uniref:cation diffusion facilitator family transporter n=1 Tax=Rhodomicrobium TaxID=1068 RepID=UPI000B4B19BE|nr:MULTISPECIES: cation diffusion facilitator family transporter [Rhodomicrobium]